MVSVNFYTKKVNVTKDYGQFIFEPLAQSFGNSMGTALRRTLLSSLKGVAITAIKVQGAPHFFTTVKGVKESVLEMVLNMKQLRFEIPKEGTYTITLSKKGAGKVYGKDMEGEIKVVNGDVYICELTDDKAKLEVEAVVETGVGYVTAEEQTQKESGFFNVDSAFSPVTKVNMRVEAARVGRKTNFDRLVMEVWTDGSISPEEAVKNASELIVEHFTHIFSGKDSQPSVDQKAIDEKTTLEQMDKKFSDLIIDELNLPSRVVNALLRENIETVADLMKTGKDKLVGLKGLGRKSLDLIEEELKKLGVSL